MVLNKGINDLPNYATEKTINGVRIQCVIYKTWQSMLDRVYGGNNP